MKISSLLLFCLFIASNAISQDLIVTNKGDSINCKISKVKEGSIWFYNRVSGTQQVNLENISFYKVGYFKSNQSTEINAQFREFENKKNQFGNDLIITNESDSIGCIIEKVETDKIWFKVLAKDIETLTFLPSENVKYFEKDYLTKELDSLTLKRFESIRWKRFSTSVGYFVRTAKLHPDLDPNLEELYEDLRTGFTFNVTYHYFIKGKHGIGFRYDYLASKAETSFQGEQVRDHTKMNFYGLSYAPRFISNDVTIINQFLLGIISFEEILSSSAFRAPVDEIEAKGQTLSAGYSFGFEFPASNEIAIGFAVDFMSGTLRKIDIDGRTVDLNDDEYEGLHRIGFTIGLRFM